MGDYAILFRKNLLSRPNGPIAYYVPGEDSGGGGGSEKCDE